MLLVLNLAKLKLLLKECLLSARSLRLIDLLILLDISELLLETLKGSLFLLELLLQGLLFLIEIFKRLILRHLCFQLGYLREYCRFLTVQIAYLLINQSDLSNNRCIVSLNFTLDVDVLISLLVLFLHLLVLPNLFLNLFKLLLRLLNVSHKLLLPEEDR